MLAIAIAGITATLVFTAFPIAVDAFWPFLTSQAAEDDAPLLHDSSIDLLDPATNPDPNPSKGTLSITTTEGSALIASGGPVGTLSSKAISGEGMGGDISLYQVREGDSLSEIADMFGVSVNTILSTNEIKDASTIQPGDTLLILPVSGVSHTVVSGDTLAGIAKKYDADLDEVASFNGLETDSELSVGDIIIVPGGDLKPKTAKKSSGGTSGGTSKALPELTGYYGNPVPGARLTQGIHGHNGVDLGAPNGTPVYAAAGGTVIFVDADGGYNFGYGNYIIISHDNGTQTLYAHLSSVSVAVGDTVEKGERIGSVGNTGRSTGYHLHFEVRGAKNPFGG